MKKLNIFCTSADLNVTKYGSRKDGICLNAWNVESGNLAYLTVDRPDIKIPRGCILVKDCNGTEGVAGELETQGFATVVGRAAMGHNPKGIAIMKIIDIDLAKKVKALIPEWATPSPKRVMEPAMC